MPTEPTQPGADHDVDPFATFGPDSDEGGGGQGLGLTDEAAGRYEAGAELGRGGIGAVQSTFDAHLGREVARKELLNGHKAGDRARFLREARITAVLEHPNIVPVYELGISRHGDLYYTMRRVQGRTLREALAEARALPDRLALLEHFVDLCNAIAFAHEHGVVHRDLKPDNVMVGAFGETVVLDWGLARIAGRPEIEHDAPTSRVQAAGTSGGHATMVGATVGTPAYMSPEQARGLTDALDERADVWSLGALLFEILTGAPPFSGDAREIVLRLRAGARPDLRPLADAPAELRAVVARALEPDPGDRYADARALMVDIAAWQRGERVSSYQYSSFELLKRVIARHRAPVAVAAVAAAALVGVSALAYGRVTQERDRAVQAERVAADGERRTRERLARALTREAQERVETGARAKARSLAAGALLLHEDAESRGAFVAGGSGWQPRLSWSAPIADRCETLRLSPSGDTLACGAIDRAHLWRTGDGAARTLPIPDENGWGAAFSPDGAWLLSPEGAAVVGYDPRTGARGPAWSADATALTAAFTTDGRLYAGLEDGRVLEFDAQRERRRTFTLAPQRVYAALPSPDGRWLAAAHDAEARIWRLDTGDAMTIDGGGERGGSYLAWVGGRVALADWFGEDPVVRLVDPEGGPVQRLVGHESEVAAITAAGRLLISGDELGDVRLWDADGRPLGRLPTDGLPVNALAVTADGRGLGVATRERVWWWELPEVFVPARLSRPSTSVTGLGFAGDTLLSGDHSGALSTWTLGQPQATQSPHLTPSGMRALAALPDGALIAAQDGEISRTDLSGAPRWRQAGPEQPQDVIAWDGWAVVSAADRLRRYDLASGAPIGDWVLGFKPFALGLSPDGARLWVSSADGGLWVALDRAGVVQEEARFGLDRGYDVAAAPGGDLLAFASRDGKVYLVDATSGARLRVLDAHREGAWSVALSPDGRTLASGGDNGDVRLWDASTGALRASLPGHGTSAVWGLAFTDDGQLLASAAGSGEIRLWSMPALDTPAAAAEAEARRDLGLDPLRGVEEARR